MHFYVVTERTETYRGIPYTIIELDVSKPGVTPTQYSFGDLFDLRRELDLRHVKHLVLTASAEAKQQLTNFALTLAELEEALYDWGYDIGSSPDYQSEFEAEDADDAFLQRLDQFHGKPTAAKENS